MLTGDTDALDSLRAAVVQRVRGLPDSATIWQMAPRWVRPTTAAKSTTWRWTRRTRTSCTRRTAPRGNPAGAVFRGGGLWRTGDGGRTWRPVIDRMRDVGILCVKIHPSIAGYIAVGLRSSIYNQDRGVLLSRNGGETWRAIRPGGAGLNIVDIALDPADPNTLYAATHVGVYKTTDGGKTWTVVLAYPPGNRFWQYVPSLAMHPTDPETLLLSEWNQGIMRTSDGGAHWTRVDQGWNQAEPMSIVAFAPSDGNVVYAKRVSPKRNPTGGHIEMFTYRSADAGRTWTQTVTLDGYEQERYDISLTVDPPAAILLFAFATISRAVVVHVAPFFNSPTSEQPQRPQR